MFKYFVSQEIKDIFLSHKLYQYSSSKKIQNLFYKQFLKDKHIPTSVRGIGKIEVNIPVNILKDIPQAIAKKRLILKEIENLLSEDILHTIKKEKLTLDRRLNFYLLGIAITFFVVFSFGLLISKNIVEKLIDLEKGLVDFLRYVKREETQFKPLSIKGEDEIDHMAGIVNEGIKETAIFVEEEVEKEKRLHTQMMEAEKMAQMGEMIGNIAHQWRQPLSMISTISTGIHAAKSYKVELSDQELIQKMEKINEYSQYLSETIDTFRDYIKDNKELKLQSLQENIKSATDIVGTVLKDVDIKLIDEVDYETPVELKMATGELSQVLINIINNAKDAIVSQNIIDGWIKLDLENVIDKYLITIEDNGGGISEDIVNKIFDPYFTTKHQSQGTGLGLHMSYKIVTESLKGSLYTQNTNNGAKFFIEIPYTIS